METRLNLLCEAGVIDKDICKGMMQVVNVLETECHLPVRSEQGTMAMTHMASALMRSRRGEEIELKWFTEFGHLNRGDMLTSEQHRCHNEKKKFQRRV